MTPGEIPQVAIDNPIPASWDAQTTAQAARAAQMAAQDDTPPAPSGAPFEGTPEQRLAEVLPQRRRNGTSRNCCTGCGAEMKEGDASHVVVARVVRTNNRYGQAKAGELVWVEPAELASAEEATIGLAQYREAVATRAGQAKPKAEPLLLKMVKQGLEATIAQTKRLIEKGREQAEMDRQRAAAEARDLRRHAGAGDQEPESQPTSSVEGSQR